MRALKSRIHFPIQRSQASAARCGICFNPVANVGVPSGHVVPGRLQRREDGQRIEPDVRIVPDDLAQPGRTSTQPSCDALNRSFLRRAFSALVVNEINRICAGQIHQP